MTERYWLDERFATPDLDPRLIWHCPPPAVQTGTDGLTVATAAGTDFWQGTHYGFRVDNGHALLAAIGRDFVLRPGFGPVPCTSTTRRGSWSGSLPDCWLKTSVEFEPGAPSRLGRWSPTMAGPTGRPRTSIRCSAARSPSASPGRGPDYLIEAAPAGHPWSQLRLGRLHDDSGGAVAGWPLCVQSQGCRFRGHFRGLSVAVA